MVRIAIADEADLMLTGVKTVLSQHSHLHVAGTYQALPDLLEDLRVIAPDVILISDRLDPELDALTLVERVQAIAPKAHLIIMSHVSDGLIVHELFASGVGGYLYKNDPLSDHLVAAIRSVVQGHPYFSPTVNAEYLLALRSGRGDWQLDGEARDVLRLLAQGCRPQEIALMRGVSVRRVYWVNNKLRRRFGAETNEHLIARAAEEGFLP